MITMQQQLNPQLSPRARRIGMGAPLVLEACDAFVIVLDVSGGGDYTTAVPSFIAGFTGPAVNGQVSISGVYPGPGVYTVPASFTGGGHVFPVLKATVSGKAPASQCTPPPPTRVLQPGPPIVTSTGVNPGSGITKGAPTGGSGGSVTATGPASSTSSTSKTALYVGGAAVAAVVIGGTVYWMRHKRR